MEPSSLKGWVSTIMFSSSGRMRFRMWCKRSTLGFFRVKFSGLGLVLSCGLGFRGFSLCFSESCRRSESFAEDQKFYMSCLAMKPLPSSCFSDVRYKFDPGCYLHPTYEQAVGICWNLLSRYALSMGGYLGLPKTFHGYYRPK